MSRLARIRYMECEHNSSSNVAIMCEYKSRTITATENVPPPLRGVQPRLRLYFLIHLHIILRLQHKFCPAKSLFSRARQTASRNTSTVTLCGPRQTECLPSKALSVAPQCPFFENDQKFWYNLYIRNEERKNPEPFL